MEFNTSKLELTKTPAVSTEETNKAGDSGKGYGFGLRHIQALLLFFCFVSTFFIRINLSVAIVSMTDKNSSNPDFHEFKWTEQEKSAILSSFFGGYLVIQAPAGQLGQHFSPKLLLLFSHLFSAILAGLTPTAAFVGGWKLMCVLRVFQGLSQGFAVPLTYNLVSKWAPPSERNRFVGFSLNGGTLGATAAMPLCGLLASSGGGWPSIFYFSCAIGIIWSIFWAWLGADSPAVHSHISEKEREYIQTSLTHTSQLQNLKTPWKAIFTSVPFWALIIAHLGNGWAFSMIITEMPSYINSVLQFNIQTNGFLSALPYLSMWALTFPVCWLADYIKKNNILSDNVSRKLWTTVSQTGGAILLVTIGFVGRDAVAAMTLLIVTVSLGSFLFSGFNINHLDLAPNFAGVLMGIANGLENITTILAPLSVGWFVTDTTSAEDWRIAFIISAIVSVTGNVVFVLFGSTKIQPWNSVDEQDSKKDNNLAI
uniref:Putative inorganic phosphate cotransporter n=1 Tax=Riptortus pedestris TaxID=329032 RepID=R4WS54_RIPPE|nr:sodium-dependent phosphate transporter [Riptortus pedestris]